MLMEKEDAFIVAIVATLLIALCFAGLVVAYRKAQADIRSSDAQERTAVALERIADALNPGGQEVRITTGSFTSSVFKPWNKSGLPSCDVFRDSSDSISIPLDKFCDSDAYTRRCWNGVGESIRVLPEGCLGWYNRKVRGGR